jgi:hypothetical protein
LRDGLVALDQIERIDFLVNAPEIPDDHDTKGLKCGGRARGQAGKEGR